MKKKNKGTTKLVAAFLALFVFLVSLLPTAVYAADSKTAKVTATPTPTVTPTPEPTFPAVLLDSYEISTDKIMPGRSFTLTLNFKNYGKASARDLLVNVGNPKGVSPKYGTLSQLFLGELKAGESKSVSMEYDSYTKITEDYLNFEVAVASMEYGNSVVLSVPVSTDNPFSITATKGPDTISAYEKATYSVSFKVVGTSNVSNVSVLLLIDGQVAGENVIGILTPGTTKTQNISTTFTTPGIYEVEQVISYEDENGILKTMKAETYQLKVESNAAPVATPIPTQPVTPGENSGLSGLSNTTYILILAGASILIIFLMVVILVKKRK